jgi:hypothetical protein
MSGFKALAWAKDQSAGSPLGKLVLILLAERADERFSCFPGVELLALEADRAGAAGPGCGGGGVCGAGAAVDGRAAGSIGAGGRSSRHTCPAPLDLAT